MLFQVCALEIDGPKVTDLLHDGARCELREDTSGRVRAVAGRGAPDPAVRAPRRGAGRVWPSEGMAFGLIYVPYL